MTARRVTTWTLEMTTRPGVEAGDDGVGGGASARGTSDAGVPEASEGAAERRLGENVRIELARHLSPEFARYLYAVVGGPWTWTDRLGWSRERWVDDLAVVGTETYVAYVDGEPAGYVQIQPTAPDDAATRGLPSVEIRYFGLVERAIGRGLGKALLQHGIEAAWTLAERHDVPATRRVWVHTCDLDGPAALVNYQRRGFHVVDESSDLMDYPTQPLGAWRSTGGPV